MKVRTDLLSVQRVPINWMEGMVEGHDGTNQLNGGQREGTREDVEKTSKRRSWKEVKMATKPAEARETVQKSTKAWGKITAEFCCGNCGWKTIGSFRPCAKDLRHMGGSEGQREASRQKDRDAKSNKTQPKKEKSAYRNNSQWRDRKHVHSTDG